MNSIHIYLTKPQPASDWTDAGMQLGFPPETLLWCKCCGQRRPAKDCQVYAYYDGPMIFCAADRGCKDPQLIAAKRAQEFANRSAAQKARYARIAAHKAKPQGLPK